MQLANSLQGIVTQTLLQKADGTGRVCALENPLPGRRDPEPDPPGEDRAGLLVHADRRAPGMQTMEQSLTELVQKRLITPTTRSPGRAGRRLSSQSRAGRRTDSCHVHRRLTRLARARGDAAGGWELMSRHAFVEHHSVLHLARTREERSGAPGVQPAAVGDDLQGRPLRSLRVRARSASSTCGSRRRPRRSRPTDRRAGPLARRGHRRCGRAAAEPGPQVWRCSWSPNRSTWPRSPR